jgi:hypothetical protein
MNVRFEYLYRDAGNFKNWGVLIFSNPNHIEVDVVTSMTENVLIEKTYFVASKARIPDLHFEKYNGQLDHRWHEFHTLVATEEAANDLLGRNIEEFIESLRCAALE